ncbi:hypothetical protein NAT51_07290 [Flavobacterium amniphilum]|uniref:hypothetical protein n=1 Tax=Flavobacterium amniphilum TaxID=1834035 RepID=UPI00202AA461|nr:hypothetical protein [Flavobacterium amniphilum]MCL9805319.1 hypothetical protein [Flavobacterium amniphilum]
MNSSCKNELEDKKNNTICSISLTNFDGIAPSLEVIDLKEDKMVLVKRIKKNDTGFEIDLDDCLKENGEYQILINDKVYNLNALKLNCGTYKVGHNSVSMCFLNSYVINNTLIDSLSDVKLEIDMKKIISSGQ